MYSGSLLSLINPFPTCQTHSHCHRPVLDTHVNGSSHLDWDNTLFICFILDLITFDYPLISLYSCTCSSKTQLAFPHIESECKKTCLTVLFSSIVRVHCHLSPSCVLLLSLPFSCHPCHIYWAWVSLKLHIICLSLWAHLLTHYITHGLVLPEADPHILVWSTYRYSLLQHPASTPSPITAKCGSHSGRCQGERLDPTLILRNAWGSETCTEWGSRSHTCDHGEARNL